jgi:tripartite-type tricarboxylate transporter receptor subunit TctC
MRAKNCVLLLCCLLSWPAAPAQAQSAPDNYPSRPVHFLVPYTPGGALDVFARGLAQHFQERTGQPMVVENRPGASQAIALDAAAKSPADGYTLVMGTQSGLVFLTAARKSLPYDPLRDFASITMLFAFPFVVTVHPSVPVRTVQELIALAKAQPGKLFYASIGTGSGHHLATEIFKTRTGIDMVHVPFKGNAQAQTDLVAGQVQVMLEGPSILPLVKSGKVRALATTGRIRTKSMPELPTVIEAGVPGFDIATWFGLSAPAGVPRPIIDRLNREVGDYLRLPATYDKFSSAGYEFMPSTPEEMTERVKSELPMWTKVMRAAGIEPE